jgi:hypothetical protein
MFKIAIEDARRLTAPDNKKSRDERFKELEAEEAKTQPVAPAVVEIKPVQ